MRKLLFATLFFGVSLACTPSESVLLYIAEARGIVAPIEKADIQYKRFTDRLGLIESSGRYNIVNKIGCIGKYQIAPATLEYLGYHGITPEAFKANPAIFPPDMQEEALNRLIKHNEKALKKFSHYIGTFVNGVYITKAGLLAAAHLAGAGGVSHYLTSNHNATDMNGASIQSYLQQFSNYII